MPHPAVHPPSAGTGSILSSNTQTAQLQRQAVTGTRFSLESGHQCTVIRVRSARQSILVAQFRSGLSSGAAQEVEAGQGIQRLLEDAMSPLRSISAIMLVKKLRMTFHCTDGHEGLERAVEHFGFAPVL